MKKLLSLMFTVLFAVQGWGQTILNESFENATFPPTDWTNYPTAFTRSNSSAHTGTYSIGYSSASSSYPTLGIITPQFTGSTGQILTFYISTPQFYGNYDWYTSFRIKISTTNNSVSSFSTIKEYSTYDYSGIYSNKVILTSPNILNTWYECTADLTAYNGQQIYVAIEVYDHWGCEGVWIDDIVIAAPLANDLTAVSLSPDNMFTGQAQVPRFKLKNNGLTAVTSSDYTIQLTDGGSYTHSISGVDLAADQDTTIAFPAYTATTAGAMTLTATITYTADSYSADNTITSTGQVYDIPVYDHNAYTLNVNNGTYYSFDVFTSTLTQAGSGISTSPYPVSETWVGTGNTGQGDGKIARVLEDGSFGYVLPDGTFVKIGNLILPVTATPLSLAYNKIDGNLYIMGYSSGTQFINYLGTIDLETLEVTLVGSETNANSMIIMGMDFDEAGNLYAIGEGTNNFYQINTTDAANPLITLVGSLGLNITGYYYLDLAYDFATQKFYSYVTLGSNSHKYGFINKTTGAFTEIAPIAVAGQYACITIISNTLPTCEQVNGVTASDITATTATVSWLEPVNTPSNGYEYFLSTSATAPTAGSTATGTANDTVTYLQNLMPTTTYYIWVRSNCGGEVSAWSNFAATFTTPCSITSIPYTQNFDASTALPSCWTMFGLFSVATTSPTSSPYTLQFNGSGTNIAMLPIFNVDVNTTQLSFVLRRESIASSGTMDIGYLANISDATSFVPVIPNILAVANVNTPFAITLSAFPAGVTNIAFRQTAASYYWYWLDNVSVLDADCIPVADITAQNLTTVSADIIWSDNASPSTSWNIEVYSTAQQNPTVGGGNVYSDQVSDTVINLTALAANTPYYVYVKNDCGWSAYSFRTNCGNISTLPWGENFDTYGTGATVFPTCWERYNNGTVSTTNPYITSGTTHSAPGAIYFSNSNSLTLVSPPFEADINTLGLKFWLRRQSPNSGTFSVGYLATPADPTSFVALTTYDDANATWIEHKINLGEAPAGIKQIAFRQNQLYYYYYWLDDITVSDCVAPENIALSNLTATSADIIWTDLASINSWTLKVSPTPLTNPTNETGNAFNGTVNDTTWQLVSGLSPATLYYVYLRNSCDTNWATYSFTTPASCPLPTNLTTNITSTTTATLTWNALGMTAWNLKVSETQLTDLDNATGGVFNGPVTGTPSQTLTDLTLGTTYYWYVQSDCGGAWAGASFTPNYCYPAPTSVDYNAGIIHVTFGISPIVDNATTPPSWSPYYNNNSAQTGGIYEGMTSFPLTITRGSGYAYIAKAWIDWNNDLVFDPVTELVGGPSNDGTGDVTFTVTVPQNQPLGSYRLRIGAIDYGDPTPCYSGFYGSYEDYTLQITPAPSCLFPINLAAIDITASSATATWTAPASAPANGYQLLVSTSATEPTGSEPEIQTTIDTFFSIGNLNPVTSYYVWVRSNCGSEDYSPWIFVNFTTPCGAASTPYTENFDAGTNPPSCWTMFGSFSVTNSYPTSSPYTLRFNGSGTTIAMLPIFNVDVNTTQLSFVLRRESIASSGPMDIGYLANITDATSFVPVMTDILAVANINTPFAITLSAFPEGVTNIAFRQTATSNYWYWLDNVSVLDADCLPIDDIAAQNLTAVSTDIIWTDNASPSTSWNVEVYATAQTNPTVGGGNVSTTTVSDTVAHLTALTPSTTYYVYIKNDCGWSDYSFTTPCEAASIPYTQNFDNTMLLPSCWTMFGSFTVESAYSTSTPNTLKFNGQGGTTIAMLPVFNVDVNTAQLSFVLRRESIAYSGTMDIGYLANITDASSFVPVISNILAVENVNTPFVITLSAFPAGVTNIAFRQTATSNYWYWLDNVSVLDASCLPVDNIATQNLTAVSTDIIWTDHNSPSVSWNVEVYATAQTNPTVGGGNVYTTTVSDTVAHLTALTPGSTYYIYIKNDCGWSDYSFTTPCEAASIPYTQNFDASTALPSCWTMFGSFSVINAYPTSSPYTLRFNGSGTNIAMLPVFNVDVNTTQLSFVLRNEYAAYSGTMDMGYLANITDASSFVPVISNILAVENVNTPFVITLSAFPAGVTNIAFRQTATSNYWYWLDNVSVLDASCLPVDNIATQNLTAVSTDIIWTDHNSPSVSWNVEVYATAQTNPTVGGGNVYTTTVSDTIAHLTALTPVTTYYIYIKNDCGWSDYSFTTPCGAASLPYTQNFDASTALPSCWTMFGSFTVLNSYPTSSPNTLRFNGSGTNIAMLPIFNVDVNTTQLSFVLRSQYANYSGPMDIGYLANIADASSFVPVMTDILAVANINTPFAIILSAFPAGVTNMAFRQSTTYPLCYWLDNVSVLDANCLPVDDIAAQNLTAISTDIIWTDHNSPSVSWNVEVYSTAQTNPTVGGGNVYTTTVSDTIAHLTALTPVTTYYVYIKNDCGWSDYSFTTPCAAASIPYTENFDASTALPSCWTMFGSFSVVTTSPTSSPYTLQFNGNGTNIAMLPVFNVDVNTTQLSFVLRNQYAGYSGTMDIGYLANIADASSFVPVMTDILAVADINTPFAITLSVFPAGVNNIAFRQTATYPLYYWLDNVSVLDTGCLPVDNIATQNLTAISTDIIWSDNNSPSVSWNVEVYATAQQNPTVGGGNVYTDVVSDTVVNLTNLTANTIYYVYIKNDCGWSSYSFRTNCTAISTFPWSENFDTYGTGTTVFPTCWERYNNGAVSTTNPYIISGTNHSAPGAIYFTNSTSLTLVSPPFEADINTLGLKFWLRREGSYSGTFSAGYLATPADPTSFVALTTYDDAAAIWIEHKINLGEAPAGIKQIAFRQNQIDSYWYYWLDDITVSDCFAPENIALSNLTATSADIVWNDLPASNSWTLKVSETPLTNPTTGTGGAFDNTVADTAWQFVSGLSPETTYYVYLRNSCDTNWATYSFTTPASCPLPTNLTATSTSSTTATLTWNALGMTDWNLKVSTTALTDFDNETGGIFDGPVTGTPSQALTDLTLGTTYYWYVQSDCGGAWANASFTPNYCYPAPYSVDNGAGIIHVTFGVSPMVDIATTPTASYPYYNDNSAQIGGVYQGMTSFPLTITRGSGYPYTAKAWIDWNNNLVFDPVTELVGGPSNAGTGDVTFTVTVPQNQPVGSYRLRIGTVDGDPTPCYSGYYGSYEDYTLQIAPMPSCAFPLNLEAIDITALSATATWIAPASAPANGYQLFVSTSNSEPTGSEPEIQTTIDTFFTIGNLNPATLYYVWVRSDCGSEDYSPWIVVNFTTPCVAASIPYTQNFDASTALPSCWTMFGSFDVADYSATSSPYTLQFNGGGTNIAMLPIFNVDVNTTQLSFILRSQYADYSGTMDIGYLTNIADATSFVPVMTNILAVADINTPFAITLSAFPAGVTNIAFRQTAIYYYVYYWLDNVAVFDADCIPVDDIATQNLTAVSTDIIWTDNASPSTSWNVEVYSTAQENPTVGGGNVYTTTVSDTVAHLTALSPVTTYYIYIKNDCGWSNYSFTTPCGAASIPYSENFDAGTNLPSCWTMFGSFFVVYDYTTSSNTLRFNGLGGTTIAMLPVFNVDVNTTQLSFVLRRESIASSGPMDIGYLANITDATSFVSVMTDILAVEEINTPFAITLSAFPAGVTNIAFRQTATNGYWYWLDNVAVLDANCLPVDDIAAQNLTTSSADIIWSDNASPSTSWNVEVYSTAQENPTVGGGNVYTTTVSDTVAHLTALSPVTTYYIYIKNDCGWSSYSFRTNCGNISTLPWSENFDTYGTGTTVFPPCWERYNNGTVSTTYPYIMSGTTHSAPGAIYFTISNSLTLVTPPFDADINTLGLKFWLRRESPNSGTFSVGYLATPADPTSFVALTTYDDAIATWIEHKIILTEAPAGIKQIAFRQNQVNIYWHYWLDDITVSNCVVPDITLSNLTPTSADIVWNDLPASNSWTLKVSSTPLTNPTSGTGGVFDNTVADTAWQLVSGLSPGSTYYVYLRNSCDTNWATYSFTTPASCPLPTNLTTNITSTTTATLTWDALGMTAWNLKVSTTALTDLDNQTGGVFDGPVTGTPSQALTDLTLGTTYYWYVQSNCGGAWANASFTPNYCYPAPVSIDGGAGIIHVTFGVSPIVDYATAPPASYPYYNDNSAQTGGIYEGMTSFPLTITRGSGYAYIAKAWIDWNNDLVFDPVTELVGGPSNDGIGNVTFTVTVPQNQPVGFYRLRIGAIDYGDPTPCYSDYYGSYEDYTLQIVPVPSCAFPINLAAINITASSATATWTAPASAPANGYQLLVSTSATEPTGSEPGIQTTIDTFFTIGSLNSLTSYYVWVRSNCGSDNYSPWMSVNFTMPCESTSIPYTENFDASTNLPSCWTMFGSLSVINAYPTSSPNTLRFNGSGTTIAMLPVFNVDVNTTQLSFVLRRQNSISGTMDIGYLANIADATSFVPVISNILTATNTITPFAITLSAFPAGVTNIAFRQTAIYNYCYWLDNVSVIDAGCLPVDDIVTQNLTGVSTDIIWSDNASSSVSWNVEVYATAQANPTVGGGNVYTTTVSDTVAHLTALTPVTTYYVYIKNDCGWSDYSFTTPCGAASIPYSENFDAGTNLPSCWTMFGSFTVTSIYATSAPYTLRFEGEGTNIAMLPVFNVDVNTAQLSFVLRRENATYSGPMDIGYLANITDASSFVPVMPNILTAVNVNTPFAITLSAFPAGVTNIAFRQTTPSYYWYWLDNVSVLNAGCLPVDNITAQNLTTTSADIIWTDNASPSVSWNVEVYSTAQQNPTVGGGNVYTTTVSDTIAHLTALTPVTTYYIYIKNDCGWSNYSFTTPCGIASIPYSENFDAGTNLPSCWTMFGSFLLSTTYPTSSPYTLQFNGSGTNIAMLPVFNVDVNTAQLSFVLRRENATYSGLMDIGYLANITDASSFVPVMPNILTAVNVNTPFAITLSAFPAGVTNIAFRQTAPSYYWYWLDNVSVLNASCLPVDNITAQNLTTTSADIIWTDNASPSVSCNVEVYSTAQENPTVGGGNVYTTTVSDTVAHLTALTPSITYYVYIKNDCGWSDYSFTTLCETTSLPYTENFDSYTGTTYDAAGVVPNCWTSSTTNTTYPAPHITGSGFYHYPHSAPNALTFTTGQNGSGYDAYAVLPLFNQPITNLTLSFWYRYENITKGTLSVGFITGTQSDISSFTSVASAPPTTTLSQFTYDFSTATADLSNATYIVLHWYHNTVYYSCGVDDIEVTSVATCPPPTALNHTTLTNNSAIITWTPGGAETEWQVAWKATAESSWNDEIVTAIPYTILNLTAVTDYDVKVRAICGAGDTSVWTAILNFTTEAVPCAPPTAVTVTTVTATTATVSWTAGDAETEWQVAWKATAESSWNDEIVTAIPYTIMGLIATTDYDVKVRAICGAGDTSVWTAIHNFTTEAVTPCAPPTAVTVTPVTATTATVSWTAGDAETEWQVAWKATAESSWNDEIVTAIPYTILNLTAVTDYDVKVRAICGAGDTSIWTAIHNFTTEIDTCIPPTAVTVAPVAAMTATVNWTPVGDETEWQVAWKATAESSWDSVGTTAASYTILNLTATTDYDVKVRAICGAGDTSYWSSVTNFTTLTCSAPDEIQIIDSTDNTITLTWQPVNGETQWNLIWRNVIAGSGSAIIENTPAYTLIELESSTVYEICVTAICGEDSESPEYCIFVSTTSAIHNIGLATALQLYPNPTTGELRIANYELREGDKIEVYNILGQPQSFSILNSQFSIIDVSHLSAGIYTVKIGGYVGKFVKR